MKGVPYRLIKTSFVSDKRSLRVKYFFAETFNKLKENLAPMGLVSYGLIGGSTRNRYLLGVTLGVTSYPNLGPNWAPKLMLCPRFLFNSFLLGAVAPNIKVGLSKEY